jgi:TPP-dependent pyruvate/acetoin dehydrogenase alpha subunit
VLAVYAAVKEARGRAVKGVGPSLIESKTYRTVGHWIGDPIRYRTKDEEELWRVKCPVSQFRKRLIAGKVLTEEQVIELENRISATVADADAFAVESPDPEPEEAFEDVYA